MKLNYLLRQVIVNKLVADLTEKSYKSGFRFVQNEIF